MTALEKAARAASLHWRPSGEMGLEEWSEVAMAVLTSVRAHEFTPDQIQAHFSDNEYGHGAYLEWFHDGLDLVLSEKP